MIESLTKFGVYLAAGLLLLSVNLWFFKFAYQGFFGGEVAVESFQVFESNGSLKQGEDNLALMLISQIDSIESELERSQTELEEAPELSARGRQLPKGVLIGAIGDIGAFPVPKAARLNTKLFSPAKLDAKISGVDVGALLPSIQRWFVQDRILKFSVMKSDDGKAIVSGDLSALNDNNGAHVWIEVEKATSDIITKSLAYALVQRSWAANNLVYAELEDDEFRTLVDAIMDVAKTNRRSFRTGTLLVSEYKKSLEAIGPLETEFPEWHELSFFAGTVAESAGELSKAIEFFTHAQETAPDDETKEKITQEIETLQKRIQDSQLVDIEDAKKKIEAYVLFATGVFNKFLKSDRKPPEVVIVDVQNSFWDGKAVNSNAAIASIPDIAYHDAAFPFIGDRKKLEFAGETGAMLLSYADILGSYAKQKKMNETAQDADWLVGEGALAWLEGHPENIATDRRPLRSLKEPANYKDKVPSTDRGSPHLNVGIPNNAFYQAAMQMDTEKALGIWMAALPEFPDLVSIPTAAKLILESAKKDFGEQSDEAKFVREAWQRVGIDL